MAQSAQHYCQNHHTPVAPAAASPSAAHAARLDSELLAMLSEEKRKKLGNELGALPRLIYGGGLWGTQSFKQRKKRWLKNV
jgi:hypothetical protein